MQTLANLTESRAMTGDDSAARQQRRNNERAIQFLDKADKLVATANNLADRAKLLAHGQREALQELQKEEHRIECELKQRQRDLQKVQRRKQKLLESVQSVRTKEWDHRFAAHVCHREALALHKDLDRIDPDVKRRHSGPVDRRDAACSEILRGDACDVVVKRGQTICKNIADQRKIFVHFAVGRCLHRSCLLSLRERGLEWLGDGWTNAHTVAAVKHWASGGEVFGPPGTTWRERARANACTSKASREKAIQDILVRRSREAVESSADVISNCGSDLSTAAGAIENALHSVGDFKAGDMVLDLAESCFGLWETNAGQVKQLARAKTWYSGEGARKALDRRAGRPDDVTSTAIEASRSRELLAATAATKKLVPSYRFGKLRREWNIAFEEYNLCEYSGFLSRSKRLRPASCRTPAQRTRGGGGALTCTGYRDTTCLKKRRLA